MTIQLNSCDSPKPNKREIAKMIDSISLGMDESLAIELTEILLAGDSVEIKIADKTSSSAYRTLRKLDINYEIID